jgi:acetylornithine deacetylase/succinyl-diaminopimelate desuccinylase-like protein
MPSAIEAALKYASTKRSEVLTDLRAFVSIPSVSEGTHDQSDIKKAAEWVAARLRAMRLERVEVLPTGGHPVVCGDCLSAGPSAPTVLVYGHYDVQSAAPLGDWETDPYTATVTGENLYARGASDMKGQIMAAVSAVEAILRSGPPPVNIKFVIEGEEEVGSPHFGGFLEQHRELLSCDLVLNPDVGMLGPDRPTIFYGLRGMFSCKLRVTGPSLDVHSGAFGGVVHNPIHALCDLIAGFHGPDGRVTLPGFYDRVRPLTKEERADMAALPLDDASYLKQSGAPQLWGEREYIPVERAGARPALDIVHLHGGSPKAAIPSQAHALLTVRLVPDQTPDEIHASLTSYLKERTPPTVRWELLECGGFAASLTDRNSPGVLALARAMEKVWGTKPLFYRSGGSIGAVGQMQKILGADSVLTGFSLPDDNIHGPNEKLHLPTWERGIDALIHFFHYLAERPRS